VRARVEQRHVPLAFAHLASPSLRRTPALRALFVWVHRRMRALRELQQRSGRAVRVFSTTATRVLRTEQQIRQVIRESRLGEQPHHGKYRQSAVVELL
jgi:hypothetical protein